MGNLVVREGLYYEKFTAEPLTGKVDEGQSRGPIKNGELEGTWVHYGSDGLLFHKDDFREGKQGGPWIDYHENNTKNEELSGPLPPQRRESVRLTYRLFKRLLFV